MSVERERRAATWWLEQWCDESGSSDGRASDAARTLTIVGALGWATSGAKMRDERGE